MANPYSEPITLAELLHALVKGLSPGPLHFEHDLPFFGAGAYKLSTAKVSCALLELSIDTQAVAKHLWNAIMTESRTSKELHFFAWSFEVHERYADGCPQTISTKKTQSPTWHQILEQCRHCTAFKGALRDWASEWFHSLLLPSKAVRIRSQVWHV